MTIYRNFAILNHIPPSNDEIFVNNIDSLVVECYDLCEFFSHCED